MSAPINKIPPEILALVPDFLDHKDAITLTHVCQTWREVFISRSSLWTTFDCEDGEETHVYLERSKSSPIHLFLYRCEDISPHDPFFQIIPYATGRLKSLSVEGTPENMQDITSHLSHPAPLLECLSIDAGYDDLPHLRPAITSTIFNGDLSSLRTLLLKYVRTELPWRNMVNLTSFTLSHTPPGAVSVGQLLDFFESAPHLRRIKLRRVQLRFATGVQNGRLVSLACLKSMDIDDNGPSSVLLDHLLVPVGAELDIEGDLVSSLIGELLPRSLDSLKNFSNVTAVKLNLLSQPYARMIFSGPNGRVSTTFKTFRDDRTDFLFESLAQFDNLKTERFEIHYGEPPSGVLLHRTLLSMADLGTVKLYKCTSPHIFIHALQSGESSSEVMVCPRLEELVLVLNVNKVFHITGLVEMAAARASRGKKLRTIGIVDRGETDLDVSELKEHVWNVEYDHEVDEP